MRNRVFVGILGAVLATTPLWGQRQHIRPLPGIGSVASELPFGGPGSAVGLRGQDFSARPDHRRFIGPGVGARFDRRRDFSRRRGKIVGLGAPAYYPYYPVVTDSAEVRDESTRTERLQQQIDELTYEVRRLREERSEHASLVAAPPQAEPVAAPTVRADTTPSVPTIIVFRDGKAQKVSNYAIVGDTLWVFGEQTTKVSLADVDIPATEKVNDEQGIPFKVPRSGR